MKTLLIIDAGLGQARATWRKPCWVPRRRKRTLS